MKLWLNYDLEKWWSSFLLQHGIDIFLAGFISLRFLAWRTQLVYDWMISLWIYDWDARRAYWSSYQVALRRGRARCGDCAAHNATVVFSIFYTLLKLLLDTKMESSAGVAKKPGYFFSVLLCATYNKEIKGHFHFTKQKRAAFESVVKVKERYLKRFWCDNHILIWGTFLMIYESEKAGFFLYLQA